MKPRILMIPDWHLREIVQAIHFTKSHPPTLLQEFAQFLHDLFRTLVFGGWYQR
jgi:hypothetical protein